MAAYNFHIRRMLTLPLNAEQQRIEWKQILHIAHSNNIPISMLTRLKLRIQRNISQTKPPIHTPLNKHTKWATFTFSSPQIRKITNIFKHTGIKIAFKCDNNISQLSKPASRIPPTTACCSILKTGHITLSSTPDQQLENHSTKYHRQQHLYNTLELLMMGIVVPETC
jgi:hypothetical protein